MQIIKTVTVLVSLVAASQLSTAGLPDEIHIIVPIAAGSSLDARARVIADALGTRLQRRIIVENRPGAGGTIGSLAAARAKPDGSTLLFTKNSHVVNPHVYKNIGYNAMKDFLPVAYRYVAGVVLVAHPSVPAASLKALVELAKNSVEPLSYASSGTGGMPHLATELLKEVAGIDLLHIPYHGDGQALTDVLAGRVPLMMSGYVVALPHIKAGTLRALAVSSKQRVAILPDVPTIAEAGYPAYSIDIWSGFFAPAGTPADVVSKLNQEISAAIALPQVQTQFADTGAQSVAASPAEFASFVRSEWEVFGKLVKRLQLKAE